MLLYTSIILATALRKKKDTKIKVKRKEWIKGWLANRARKGAYRNIIRELKLTDKENYRRYLRMDEATFKVILSNFCLILEPRNN